MLFLQRLLPICTALIMLFSVQITIAQTESETNVQASAAETTAAININTATAEELQTLKGIGLTKAQAIVAYRSEQEKFKSVNDLANVKGFGEKTVAKLLAQNPNRIIAQ